MAHYDDFNFNKGKKDWVTNPDTVGVRCWCHPDGWIANILSDRISPAGTERMVIHSRVNFLAEKILTVIFQTRSDENTLWQYHADDHPAIYHFDGYTGKLLDVGWRHHNKGIQDPTLGK